MELVSATGFNSMANMI